MSDARALFALANDRSVRVFALNPEPVEWEGHCKWLEARLASADCRLWMVEVDGDFVGQIRYDRENDDVATLSFSVVGDARGRGIGTAMLKDSWKLGCRALSVPCVRGVVVEENEASIRTFYKAGFREVDRRDVAGKPCRIFIRCTGDPE